MMTNFRSSCLYLPSAHIQSWSPRPIWALLGIKLSAFYMLGKHSADWAVYLAWDTFTYLWSIYKMEREHSCLSFLYVNNSQVFTVQKSSIRQWWNQKLDKILNHALWADPFALFSSQLKFILKMLWDAVPSL